MKISSSLFENNNAFYGGAIYLYQENNYIEDGTSSNNNDENINFEITDSIFQNNNANYYGGALFINTKSINLNNLKNNTFIGNKAYAGGAIYTSIDKINDSNNEKNIKSQFKSNKVNFDNNISESHGNDYASNPLMINTVLSSTNKNGNKIKSGETYSLSFNMTDIYGQIVKDMSKYYNNFMISLKNKNEENSNDDIILTDNNCIFSNGKKLI